jgi:hypothetical protein
MHLLPKKIKPIHMVIGAGIIVAAIILYKKRMSLSFDSTATMQAPTNFDSNAGGSALVNFPCSPSRMTASGLCCGVELDPNGQCNP